MWAINNALVHLRVGTADLRSTRVLFYQIRVLLQRNKTK
jgi:hypothetical protein